MKCPACGYNSFGFLDSCKKCSLDLTGVKESYGIEPVLIWSPGKPDAALPASAPAPPVEPVASSPIAAPDPAPALPADLLFDLSLLAGPAPTSKQIATAEPPGDFIFERIDAEAPQPMALSWSLDLEMFSAHKTGVEGEEASASLLDSMIRLEDLNLSDPAPPCVTFDGEALRAFFAQPVIETKEQG